MDLTRTVKADPRRGLPSVDRLTRDLCAARPELPKWAATEAARAVVGRARFAIEASGPTSAKTPMTPGEAMSWLELAHSEASRLVQAHPRRVINATGVVLHTNLGRAPIARGAAEAAASVGAGYCDLELDVASGKRGNRLSALAEKLRLLSGAEAATLCNNNAAAVLLALNTLAAGREVIVSRGELVEIGGSFRVPEIMERAGVRLVEVGTTNRTHPRDYSAAIGPETALLLKVHRSNFEQRGFVREVSLGELVEIGRAHELPVMEDLGSGTLLDLTDRGFPADAFAPSRVRLGADLVCFSGDKLIGGPQAGLIVGREEIVQALRSNPLARALRLDKMTIAALDWTLARMLDGDALREIPVLQQLLESADEIEARAGELATRLLERVGGRAKIDVTPDRVPVGGGSLPGFELDSWVVRLSELGSVEHFVAALRSSEVPVLTRVRDDAVIFDLRTLSEPDYASVATAVELALD
jgi:L-seryl-tRNA(Ser) seleniumtransferase